MNAQLVLINIYSNPIHKFHIADCNTVSTPVETGTNLTTIMELEKAAELSKRTDQKDYKMYCTF